MCATTAAATTAAATTIDNKRQQQSTTNYRNQINIRQMCTTQYTPATHTHKHMRTAQTHTFHFRTSTFIGVLYTLYTTLLYMYSFEKSKSLIINLKIAFFESYYVLEHHLEDLSSIHGLRGRYHTQHTPAFSYEVFQILIVARIG